MTSNSTSENTMIQNKAADIHRSPKSRQGLRFAEHGLDRFAAGAKEISACANRLGLIESGADSVQFLLWGKY
jgi:hypothetical protein